MRRTASPGTPSHRYLVAVIGGGLLLLLLVGIGVYGLLRGPGTEPAPRTPAVEAPAEPAPGLEPRPVTESPDGERFARGIAERLFAWDTSMGRMPADYMQPLIDAADPAEAPGLAADLRAYFPDDPAWGELRKYSTRQWLTIEAATIPESWAGIVAQAKPGLVPPGATAYTITGTRHRAGLWDDKPVEDARPVSFTIFAACPDGDACRLLRLSAPDQPLR